MLFQMDALRRSGIEFVLCQQEGNAWIMPRNDLLVVDHAHVLDALLTQGESPRTADLNAGNGDPPGMSATIAPLATLHVGFGRDDRAAQMMIDRLRNLDIRDAVQSSRQRVWFRMLARVQRSNASHVRFVPTRSEAASRVLISHELPHCRTCRAFSFWSAPHRTRAVCPRGFNG
jgi:hypothetical protein